MTNFLVEKEGNEAPKALKTQLLREMGFKVDFVWIWVPCKIGGVVDAAFAFN